MTHEEQGQAIADHLGWIYDDANDEMVATIDGNIITWQWPSLDAMLEVKKWLFIHGLRRCGRALDMYETQEVYRAALLSVCKRPNPELTATATEEADAFFCCLNLYEE